MKWTSNGSGDVVKKKKNKTTPRVKAKPAAVKGKKAAAGDAFRLVAATRADADLWKSMRADMYDGLDEASHDREIDAVLDSVDRACLLVYAPGGDAVGFLEVSLRNVVDGCVGSPVGYIEGIYLVPVFRGLGLGGVLIDEAARWFAEHGCVEMATDTEIDDDGQQEFWSGLGFEETWRTVQYRRPIASLPARGRRPSR
ncbi:MAG TPA: GNAT family N-acetyltransferase [Candidatus Krumholzibacteria bacterium]|nr:GNAT family N-acetyltransferase [Candidatus Krumholzibacteria bacterium]